MHFDITSKTIVEKGKYAIFRKFLKQNPVLLHRLESLPQEQPSLKKGDYLFKVTDQQGQDEIQIWEFKTDWKANDVLSLMDYTIRARQTYHLPAVPIMFLFLENKSANGFYEDEQFQFRFQLIKMWEEDSKAILDSEDYFIYPFIPIMKCGEDITLDAEKKLYNSPLDRSDKADLLTALTIFAGLRDKDLCLTLIERRRDIMVESYAYELLTKDAMEVGIEKGIEKGIVKGIEKGVLLKAREAVLTILEVRFQFVPHTVKEAVEKITDLARLDQLHREAVVVGSMDDFIKKII